MAEHQSPRPPLVLLGHRSARDQARARLTALVTREDGTPDGGLVRVVAALGLPQADRALAAQVIARATGDRLHERDPERSAGEGRLTGGRRARAVLVSSAGCPARRGPRRTELPPVRQTWPVRPAHGLGAAVRHGTNSLPCLTPEGDAAHCGSG